MSNAQTVSITTPVGRIVTGDVYQGRDKDAEGRPLVIKHGPNAGQPRVEYYIGLAVPKGSEQHWNQTEWGQKIYQVAREQFPNLFDPNTGDIFQGRQFAFKVTDGDSQVPNQNNIRPCDREGWAGHWVMHWSNGFAPKCYNADGSAPLLEQVIKRGHYIQINGTVNGNGSQQQPGVFLNCYLVAHSGYGPEIVSGPDASAVGFGGALPAGASATPIGGMAADAPAAPAPAPAAPAPAPAAPAPAPAAPVAPAPAPAAPVAPAPAPAAPVAPAHDLVQPQVVEEEKYDVNGTVYTKSQLLAMPGWTEAHLATLPRA